MSNIIEYVLCIIESGITFIFLSLLLERKSKKYVFIIFAIIFNASISYLCADLRFFLRAIINLTAAITVSCVLFKGKTHIKISFSVVLIFLYNIIDTVFELFFLSNMDKYSYADFFDNIIQSTTIYLIIKAAKALVVFVIYVFFSKIRLDASRKAWNLFCFVMSIYLFVTIAVAELYRNSPGEPLVTTLYFAISASIFITGMIIIYFFTFICNSFQNEKKMYIIQSNYEGIKEQLAIQSSNSEKLAKIKHDMRNHLLSARQLLSQNQYKQAENLLSEMIDRTDNLHFNYNAMTGNDIIDAAIAVKAAVCSSRNIRFELKAGDLPHLNISKIDLSSLFSNILDNAITAAAKTVDPFISLNIFIRGDYLNIISENPFSGEIRKSEKNKLQILSTTKRNSSEHGFGTRIISEITQKYDGVCVYEYEGGVFKMNVMLKIEVN